MCDRQANKGRPRRARGGQVPKTSWELLGLSSVPRLYSLLNTTTFLSGGRGGILMALGLLDHMTGGTRTKLPQTGGDDEPPPPPRPAEARPCDRPETSCWRRGSDNC